MQRNTRKRKKYENVLSTSIKREAIESLTPYRSIDYRGYQGGYTNVEK